MLQMLILSRKNTPPRLSIASAILALPFEIRDKIWEFVFEDGTRYRPQISSARTKLPFWKTLKAPPSVRWEDLSTPILLVDKELGEDAQMWLFTTAKAVVFDDFSHLRQVLGSANCWGPIRSVETLSFRHYNNDLLGSLPGSNNQQLGIAMSREAVEMARSFKNRMNTKFPGDLVEIDWKVSIRKRVGYWEVELQRKPS